MPVHADISGGIEVNVERRRRVLPRAVGARNLVVEHLGEELLVYDLRTHEALALGPAVAAVFARCDGSTTLDEAAELSAVHGQAPHDPLGLVERIVDELAARGLVEDIETRRGAPISRRSALRKAGRIAAAAIAAPLVQSIVAPSIAEAASCGGVGQPCCVGFSCDGPAVCIDNTCQDSGEGG